MFRILSCLAILASAAIAGEPLASGPAVGQKPGPYSFLVASGPERGQQTCFVCETAEKPGVIVFARSISSPLAKLMTECDGAIAARPKDTVRGWMTVLGEKSAGLDDLGKWSKQHGLATMPVGVFDDAVGPPSYKLSTDADVTVILFVDRKVTGTFAYRTGELDGAAAKKVAAAVTALGQKK